MECTFFFFFVLKHLIGQISFWFPFQLFARLGLRDAVKKVREPQFLDKMCDPDSPFYNFIRKRLSVDLAEEFAKVPAVYESVRENNSSGESEPLSETNSMPRPSTGSCWKWIESRWVILLNRQNHVSHTFLSCFYKRVALWLIRYWFYQWGRKHFVLSLCVWIAVRPGDMDSNFFVLQNFIDSCRWH